MIVKTCKTPSKNGLVSVILPVFNGSKFINTAIDSVVSQTYQNFEIIAVDDGSSDNSFEILSQRCDSRIRIFRKANGGVAHTRNYAIQRSKGEFIAFLDQDEEWFCNKLEKQIDFINAQPDYPIVYTDAISICLNNSRQPLRWSELYKPTSGFIFSDLYRTDNFILLSSVFLKKSLIDEVGFLCIDKAFRGVDDFEFWLRISQNHKFGYIPEVLVKRTVHADNFSYKSKKSLSLMIENALHVYRKYYQLSEKISRRDYSNAILRRTSYMVHNRLYIMLLQYLCFAFIIDPSNVIGITGTLSAIFGRLMHKLKTLPKHQ